MNKTEIKRLIRFALRGFKKGNTGNLHHKDYPYLRDKSMQQQTAKQLKMNSFPKADKV